MLRASLVAIALVGVGIVAGLLVYVRTPYITEQNEIVPQPVDFDHRHHVVDDRIDCLYCHHQADEDAVAGMPSTALCMGCHAQIWNDSPQIEPLRRAWFSGQPIAWNRVHDLPDFTYFHHGVHTRSGVACADCHGDVAAMAAVVQQEPLTMGWCLDCHREPHEHVRNPSAVPFRAATHCTACHR